MATNKYTCKVCGYVHTGDCAPAECPVCKVGASEFAPEKKKSPFSDKNSNIYIVTYSTVMVVLVALVLSFVALSLKDLQNANMLNEKKSSILVSLDASSENYDSYITAFAVDASGKKIAGVEGDAVINMLSDLKGTFAAGSFPVFQAKDGKVVLPVEGQGLWGPIWGYIALEADMSTVSGIVMDHAGETPGLGAEIATPKHEAQYVGKSIFEGSKFVSITLVKGGANPAGANFNHEVDGISGGTKTGDGVTAMLYNSLEQYVPFLKSNKVKK
ncbi:MAG: NADH:ubiquinone reductase (Na(+)-transporting) subunit C [Rikenellaceae bacterium]